MSYLLVIKAPFMQFPDAAGLSYQALQARLTEAVSSLNLASSKVVTSMKREPDEQSASANNFVGCYKGLLTAGLMLASVAKACVIHCANYCARGCCGVDEG